MAQLRTQVGDLTTQLPKRRITELEQQVAHFRTQLAEGQRLLSELRQTGVQGRDSDQVLSQVVPAIETCVARMADCQGRIGRVEQKLTDFDQASQQNRVLLESIEGRVKAVEGRVDGGLWRHRR